MRRVGSTISGYVLVGASEEFTRDDSDKTQTLLELLQLLAEALELCSKNSMIVI